MKIRSVRPEFFTDPMMASLDPMVRLLYVGLWCYVDDEGRGEWLPKQIEGAIFPFEDVDIHALLEQLVRSARIVRYTDGDREFFHIPTFSEYQKPNRKYDSRLPDPSKCSQPTSRSASAVREQRVRSVYAHAGEGEGEGVGRGNTHREGESEGEGVSEPKLPAQRALDLWEAVTGTRLTRGDRRRDHAKAADFLAATGLDPDTADFRAFLEYAHEQGTWAVGGWGRAYARWNGRPKERAPCGRCGNRGVLAVLDGRTLTLAEAEDVNEEWTVKRCPECTK